MNILEVTDIREKYKTYPNIDSVVFYLVIDTEENWSMSFIVLYLPQVLPTNHTVKSHYPRESLFPTDLSALERDGMNV